MNIVKEKGKAVRIEFDGVDLETEKAEMSTLYAELKPQVDALEARRDEINRVESILRELPTSWSQRDPGKYGRGLWFSDRLSLKKAIVPEFIGDGQEPPNTYPLVRQLSELETAACPDCGVHQPVIYEYEQTYDSPDGDDWRLRTLVICCGKIHVLFERNEGNRFF